MKPRQPPIPTPDDPQREPPQWWVLPLVLAAVAAILFVIFRLSLN